MRTSVIAIVLLVSLGQARAEPWSDRTRLTISLPAEVTLVGLTAGVRPELLYRFCDPSARSRVRFAIGLLDGPEQFFMPISLGYRAIFRQSGTVQPQLGAGLELQHRFVSDFHAVRQFGFYVEGGVGFAFDARLAVGAMVALDVMMYGGPGAGLGPRVFVSWRF